jgi:hypothetical protein
MRKRTKKRSKLKKNNGSTSFHVRLILENYKEQNRNGM